MIHEKKTSGGILNINNLLEHPNRRMTISKHSMQSIIVKKFMKPSVKWKL